MTANLHKLINPDAEVSVTVLKHWLKVNGFSQPVVTGDDLAKLLDKLIKSGELTRQKLDDAVREIEENGGKRIFLRYLLDKSSVSSQKAFEKHLESKKLRLAETPTITKYKPKEPVINYISWEPKQDTKGKPRKDKKRGDKIRIKFSETQLRRNVDLEAGKITDEEKTKFVVATVELGTGFTCIFVDYPELVHRHKDRNGISKRELYEQFYLNQISEIFDSPLAKYDLEPVIERLVHTKPHVIRIPNEKVKTGGNSRQSYASINDVRYDPARQGAEQADGENWQFEDLAGYWIPEMSKGKLHRELFTQLVRANSIIRVLADCLASEINYVISRIR